MDPSTVQVPHRAQKPSRAWIAIVLLAGSAGALGSVAALGTGTYDIAPFTVQFRAAPAALGKTELAIRPEPEIPGVPRQHAEAGTHRSPIAVRASITGVTSSGIVRRDREVLTTPYDLAAYIGSEGKVAIRRFAIKLAVLALAGSGAAGLLISFGRWRRILGAVVAGLVTFAIIGFLLHRTYDTAEFKKTQWVVDSEPGNPLPTLLPS